MEKENLELLDKTKKEGNPKIRIKKIELNNFKNIDHGEISLSVTRKHKEKILPILGIYGPNGSGKTSFIEALAILKALMSGEEVPLEYIDCIAEGKSCAKLKFVFEIKHSDNIVFEATYSFCMGRQPLTIDEIEDNDENYWDCYSEEKWKSYRQTGFKPNIHSERFVLTKKENKNIVSQIPFILHPSINSRINLHGNSSAMFSQLLWEGVPKDDFKKVLLELQNYAKYYFYVVSRKSLGLFRSNNALLIHLKEGKRVTFNDYLNTPIPIKDKDEIKEKIESINPVLKTLIPGLTIKFTELPYDPDSTNIATEPLYIGQITKEPSISAKIEVCREGKSPLPLRYESDNIKKIISVLPLIIEVFNQSSATVAIDDFDAGMFEYMLGELLKALATKESEECGQFIFTAHDLRPLETLGQTNKDFLCFTTTDPKNRTRLTNTTGTSNLRDVYLSKINPGEKLNKKKKKKQDESTKEKLEGESKENPNTIVNQKKRIGKFDNMLADSIYVDSPDIRYCDTICKALNQAGSSDTEQS